MRLITQAELLNGVESQETEFKTSLSLQHEGLEALCAMVNSDRARGRVLFGVAPDGTAVGVESGNLDSAQRTLTDRAKRGFDPPLHIVVDVFACGGKPIVSVEAQRSPAVPLHEFDGRALIREGATKRRLSVAERSALMRRRDRASHPGPWRCERCNTTIGTLSQIEIGDSGASRSYRCDCGGEFWPAG